MSEDLKNTIKKFSKMKQYKDKDPSTIEKVARISLWKKQIDIKSRYPKSKDDQQTAEKILDSYLQNYAITSFDQVKNLADLVFEEVMKHRTQVDISKISADDSNLFISDKLIDNLHKIEERIWKIKEKVGIFSDNKKDDLTALEDLKKKFAVYIPFNRNEFTLWSGYTCSGCGKKDVQPLLLRRRVKDFEVLKHPAFSGRFLYNVEIMNDVRDGKITKEMAGRYLKTSPHYIDWALENEFKIIHIDNIEQSEVDDFIDANPFLKDAIEYKKNINTLEENKNEK